MNKDVRETFKGWKSIRLGNINSKRIGYKVVYDKSKETTTKPKLLLKHVCKFVFRVLNISSWFHSFSPVISTKSQNTELN